MVSEHIGHEIGGTEMAQRTEHGLMSTLLGVSTVMLAVAIMLIAGLAMRPAGGIPVPKGYHVVHVSLAEWSVTGAPTSLPAGDYEFVITNHGTIPHELVMWATKAVANALPRRGDGSINEDSSALNSVLDTGSSLLPGETRVVFADLTAPGHYAMACNLPTHYRLGMRADLTVH
jgi:uncharacterized cupredoxin-like copper-binding protein